MSAIPAEAPRAAASRSDRPTRCPAARRAGPVVIMASLLAACATGAKPAAPSAATAPTDAPRDASTATTTALRFVEHTAASGVDYVHQPSRSPKHYMPEIMGSGVAVADVDRDGDPDLLFAGGGRVAGDAPDDSGPRLFLNDGGGRFADHSAEWGLPPVGAGYPFGVAVGDVDGDGWIDAYLTSWGGGNTLLRNDGTSFTDVTTAWGAGSETTDWSSSAGFLDIDNDGDLDLYIARYVEFSPDTAIACWHGEMPIYCTPQLYTAQPDRLLRQEGDGRFVDVSVSAGIADTKGKGLALGMGDIDDDGDFDVFVADDLTPNLLLINDGAGVFVDRAPHAGVAVGPYGQAMAGMGADMGDIDGDGRLDIVDANFKNETTNVFLQGEGLLFDEVSEAMGVGAASRERLKWGIDLFDADNDGDEDLLVVAGHLYVNVALVEEPGTTMEQPNLLFENRDGAFVDVSAAAGDALTDSQVSRGLITSDLDGDGDLDYVVAQNGGTAQVALNKTAPIGGWIGLWLEGRTANRSAIGARVTARIGERAIVREVRGAASYLSVPDLRIHLGLGDAAAANAVTVRWPGGDVQELGPVEGGRWYHVVQGEAPVPFVPGEAVIAP